MSKYYTFNFSKIFVLENLNKYKKMLIYKLWKCGNLNLEDE